MKKNEDRRVYYDPYDRKTPGKESYGLRRVQKHLPVRMQDELHGRQPVLRARHERREDRKEMISPF